MVVCIMDIFCVDNCVGHASSADRVWPERAAHIGSAPAFEKKISGQIQRALRMAEGSFASQLTFLMSGCGYDFREWG
jgi:hypothetical protein